jgi:hypothetical protein
MLKKRTVRLVSISLIMSGILILIGSFSITGFVVSDGAVNHISFPFGLILVFAGIISFLMVDGLQQKLGSMEAESPSHSLKGKKQTFGEKISFAIRSMFGGAKLVGEDYHRPLQDYSPAPDEIVEINGKTYGPFDLDREYESILAARKTSENEIKTARAGLLKSKKYLDESFKKREFSPWMFEKLDELEEAYKKAGMEFSKQRYLDFLAKKGDKAYKTIKEEVDRMLSNEKPVRDKDVEIAASELSLSNSFRTRARGQYSEEITPEMLDKEYARKAKTLPISEVSKQYGVTFVHSLPFTDRNAELANNDSLTREEKTKQWDYFLEKVVREKPAISASSVGPGDEVNAIYSPIGIVLREGRIYDAGPRDMGSRAKKGVRYRAFGAPGPLENRIREAVTKSRSPGIGEDYNEFVLGEGSEIQGLYFADRHLKWGYDEHDNFGPYAPEVVANLAQKAVEMNVPLYKFSQGRGFIEVNPKDYMPQKKPARAVRKRTAA